MYIHTYTHKYIHTSVCTYTYIYTGTCIYMYMYIHTYTHPSIHTYIHIYIHTGIHTYIDSQTGIPVSRVHVVKHMQLMQTHSPKLSQGQASINDVNSVLKSLHLLKI